MAIIEQHITQLIQDYSLHVISADEFLDAFPVDILRGGALAVDLITEGMHRDEEDEIDVGFTLMLVQSDLFDIPVNANVLCALLENNSHHRHEDIAMVLKEIKAPSTVDCLYNAIGREINYLEYDDTFQFARKCIKAISAIDNEYSIERLWQLSDSANVIIAGYAKKELSYKGLL